MTTRPPNADQRLRIHLKESAALRAKVAMLQELSDWIDQQRAILEVEFLRLDGLQADLDAEISGVKELTN